MSYLFRGFFNESYYFVCTSEVKASIKVVHRQKKKVFTFYPSSKRLKIFAFKIKFSFNFNFMLLWVQNFKFCKEIKHFGSLKYLKKSHCHVLNRWNLLTAEIVVGYMYLYLRNLLLQEFTQNISRNWVILLYFHPFSHSTDQLDSLSQTLDLKKLCIFYHGKGR